MPLRALERPGLPLGRTAFVTGGTKGIGRAIADRLAMEGISTLVCSRTMPMDFHLSHHVWMRCDVLKEGDIERLAPELKDVDILVNNVGGGGRWGTDFLSMDTGIYADLMAKNVWPAVKFTKLCLPNMLEKKWGRVVTIASIYGAEAGGKPWFNMAKSAEISFMKALSREKDYVRSGVTFNTVCPGHIRVEGKPDDTEPERFPMGRMGSPEEIASVVAFLCSEEVSFVNGACIMADGGESHGF
jgi:3-oxoacyl-[acyl-carrier protein] reductase